MFSNKCTNSRIRLARLGALSEKCESREAELRRWTLRLRLCLQVILGTSKRAVDDYWPFNRSGKIRRKMLREQNVRVDYPSKNLKPLNKSNKISSRILTTSRYCATNSRCLLPRMQQSSHKLHRPMTTKTRASLLSKVQALPTREIEAWISWD